VLLHGFSGTGRGWDGVAAVLQREGYLPLAPDLPGHGSQGAVEEPIEFESCTRYVLEQAPERFVLAGYSMGGRIALHVALAAPDRVSRLVLISCTAGIADPAERAERAAADHRLVEELDSMPFEDFIERWRTQPLFAEEPPAAGRLAREDQRRNRPEALAAALRGLVPGEMEPLWGRLADLEMPVTVVAGERDTRYVELGRRMADAIEGAQLLVIPGGHGLPLENPQGVADAVALDLG
jgi:2-succinyl-6-hydroxy-2,4-cyclohexadiene-1-carboxylate synthase